MSLIGVLKDGTRIEAIALCEFNRIGDPLIRSCDETPKYRVRFVSGHVFNACEEHAQCLWDAELQPAGGTEAR